MALPGDPGPEAGSVQPPDLFTRAAGLVVGGVGGSAGVPGIVGDDHITEDESAAWAQDGRDPREQVRLCGAVEVVHGQRGHHQVERAGWQRVLQPADVQVGGG